MTQQNATLPIPFLRESIKRKFSMPDSMDKKTIGLELELFPFKNSTLESTFVTDIINEKLRGSYDLLYANSLCVCSLFEPDKKLEVPRLNSKHGGIVTFEPGGQIEYSSSADDDLSKVIEELIFNVSELEHVLAKDNVKFFFGSINPWQSVEEVGLKMKKPRYKAMDRYFSNIGPHGQQMMRLTGSLQVNLDFGDPETAEKRWLATNLISPIFTAMFGNSPFLNGELTGYKSYRTFVWQQLDKSRSGFPHIRVSNGSELSYVEQYLRFALDAAVFRLPDDGGCLGYRENHFSFQRWVDEGYNGYYPSIEDWDIHLTTLFPDVRPKGFLECRFIDGQAKPAWAVPAILVTMLTYDEDSTAKIIKLLSQNLPDLEKMSNKAAVEGVNAFPDLCKEIFSIALNGQHYAVDSSLLEYCERFFAHYTNQLRNPADDLLELNQQKIFNLEQYHDYEARLFEVLQPPASVATQNWSDLACGCDC